MYNRVNETERVEKKKQQKKEVAAAIVGQSK